MNLFRSFTKLSLVENTDLDDRFIDAKDLREIDRVRTELVLAGEDPTEVAEAHARARARLHRTTQQQILARAVVPKLQPEHRPSTDEKPPIGFPPPPDRPGSFKGHFVAHCVPVSRFVSFKKELESGEEQTMRMWKDSHAEAGYVWDGTRWNYVAPKFPRGVRPRVPR